MQQGGQTGPGGQRAGLSYVTKTNSTLEAHQMVRAYFTAAGVDLTAPGKMVFFNDRLGELLVKASLSDLEIIQQAIEMLNQTPPQIMIEAKFADLTQEDARGLGFNWYLGNTLMNNGAIGLQGGTAPSYQGPATTANPSGIFPGGGSPTTAGTAGAITTPQGTFLPGPGVVASSATDNLLTGGVRNQDRLATLQLADPGHHHGHYDRSSIPRRRPSHRAADRFGSAGGAQGDDRKRAAGASGGAGLGDHCNLRSP